MSFDAHSSVADAQAHHTLSSTGIELSRVGFGCASLMRLPSARARRDLIAAAIDAGITHFDVARMYGLGAAEAELGRALRRRSEPVTIATKFGIDASGAMQRLGRLQAPARALLGKSSKLRARVRARGDSFATPRRYDVDKARTSLDRSLLELGVEHVDILFLHDPRPQDVIEKAALVEFLETAKDAGKIRAWGSSVDTPAGIEQMTNLPGGLLQVRIDPLTQPPAEHASLVFGLMARHELIAGWLRGNPDAHRAWSAALGADPLRGELLARLLLAQAMTLPSAPVALYATTRVSRLQIAAQALASPPEPQVVAAFAKLLASHGPEIIGSAPADEGSTR